MRTIIWVLWGDRSISKHQAELIRFFFVLVVVFFKCLWANFKGIPPKYSKMPWSFRFENYRIICRECWFLQYIDIDCFFELLVLRFFFIGFFYFLLLFVIQDVFEIVKQMCNDVLWCSTPQHLVWRSVCFAFRKYVLDCFGSTPHPVTPHQAKCFTSFSRESPWKLYFQHIAFKLAWQYRSLDNTSPTHWLRTWNLYLTMQQVGWCRDSLCGLKHVRLRM